MRPSSRLLALPLAALAIAALTAAPSSASTPPLPNSMAAIGDSITRAYDVCCWYGDHAGDSWSTGGTWYDGVTSQYERIKKVNGAIAGHNHNDAVTGAKMSAAATQASNAVAQGAQYVTILMGANDLCTSSVSTMTSTTTFAAQFRAAMDTLHAGLPHAHVFVASIPNIYQLWQVLHTNWLARSVWSAAHICQSMLSSSNTETQRQQVVAREQAFNQILANTCAAYANCKWDGGAVYRYAFSAGQVSTLDYFHPSLSGQAALASVTWAASYWPTTA
jgi:lysophospholipase L1-like esterase